LFGLEKDNVPEDVVVCIPAEAYPAVDTAVLIIKALPLAYVAFDNHIGS
jgi:hypothetical protein